MRARRSLCVLGAVLTGHINGIHMTSDVDDTLNGLTLDEALGQLFQLETPSVMMNGPVLNQTSLARFAKLGIGSYLNGFGTYDRNGYKDNLNASEFRAIIDEIMRVSLENQPLNPIFYGLDSVHGANYIGGATIFPQQINIASTFDLKYAYQAAVFASDDTAGAGAKMIFAPVADVAHSMRFPRVQETFGESAFLVSRMVAESVKGIQKSKLVTACPKHFIAYQSTPNGYDRTNADSSMFHLVNFALKPYIAAFDAGALSVMESYSSLNTIPMVENSLWLRTILRDILKFDGMVLTDYKEVQNAVDFHFTSKNYSTALKRAIMAGNDMFMVVDYAQDWISIVKQLMQEDPSFVPYVKTAISRVIGLKKKLGLYTNPYSGKELIAKVGSQESIDLAIQIARDSIVLLRNTKNLLPLKKTSKIFLSGNAFDNAGQQCGGWCREWQGMTGNTFFSKRITILDGMKKYAEKLTYTVGFNVSEEYNEEEVSKALGLAKDADVCVVALGERPGTEKPFDIDDLAIPVNQTKYLDAMKASCKQLVLVLVQARPRTFNDSAEIGAIVNTALVGPYGGQAIAEVLLGMYNPNGRQVLNYAMRDGQSTIRHDTQVDTMCNYGPCVAEYPFGHGLSYTNFSYSNLMLDARNISCTGTLKISVDVTNNGPMDGKEAVLVFLQQKVRTHVPEVKNLVEFTKIFLRVGEMMTVTFTLKEEAWTYLSPNIEDKLRRICEPSEFFVAVKYDTLCKFKGEETNAMCAKFDVV